MLPAAPWTVTRRASQRPPRLFPHSFLAILSNQSLFMPKQDACPVDQSCSSRRSNDRGPGQSRDDQTDLLPSLRDAQSMATLRAAISGSVHVFSTPRPTSEGLGGPPGSSASGRMRATRLLLLAALLTLSAGVQDCTAVLNYARDAPQAASPHHAPARCRLPQPGRWGGRPCAPRSPASSLWRRGRACARCVPHANPSPNFRRYALLPLAFDRRCPGQPHRQPAPCQPVMHQKAASASGCALRRLLNGLAWMQMSWPTGTSRCAPQPAACMQSAGSARARHCRF